MFDPAVEAANRAYVVRRTRVRAEAVEDLKIARVAEAAAREALKPLREVHEKHMAYYAERYSGDALTIKSILRDFARHIYPEDELT